MISVLFMILYVGFLVFTYVKRSHVNNLEMYEVFEFFGSPSVGDETRAEKMKEKYMREHSTIKYYEPIANVAIYCMFSQMVFIQSVNFFLAILMVAVHVIAMVFLNKTVGGRVKSVVNNFIEVQAPIITDIKEQQMIKDLKTQVAEHENMKIVEKKRQGKAIETITDYVGIVTDKDKMKELKETMENEIKKINKKLNTD